MATWSDVELLTNEDTNTVRLDSVSGEEHGSGLYQVDTLVKISSSDKVIKTDVDTIDVCLDGRFLVVCERNGNLHLIYVPHKRILFTRVREIVFLIVWDLHFLVMTRCWPELAIHDFELTTECVCRNKVVQLSLHIEISLQIRCLPSMSVCYSLDVSSVSCLVQMKTNMDTIYLVEGICENPESRGEAVASVVVRCLTEALPENRLSRLLHKHMFEEAEKFAITFDLDLELVYKVKLDFVLEQLASASVGGYGQEVWSELVDEAKTNLMKITDEQYVVDYCLKAPWPTFDTAEKMLNHAASRYASLQIQEALARLATFCSLHGVENFNGIAWIEFLNSTDILGDVLTHLREGDMRGAQLLWLRYEIALEFEEKSLEAVLGAIPEDLPSQDLCPWLRTVFVPFVRRVLPRGQRILAKWLELKARNLELTEKGSWPQNGLDLAIIGLPSLWTWMKSIDDSDGANELQSLRSLVSNLRQLLDLHHKYSCRLSLSVFEKGSRLSVAFFMLDKVPAPELIAATVESSVRPYAEEHALPFDELLLQYIKDLLERCSSQTTTLFTGWEGKAVAVLSCMTDTDLKVDAVLEIMQKAVVPWSNVVERLVQQYLEMDGPKCELLKESYRLMEIRKLLRGYGIRNFNLSNGTQSLIRYILKQDLPMSLEDSLTLAAAYKLPTTQINYLYLTQLIGQGKEVLTVLKRLSSAEAECVIERLTSWARLQLEDKMAVAQVMVEALKYLHFIQKRNCNLLPLYLLPQEDFDVFFTPSNYEDPNIRKQIQDHHITAYENTRARRSSKGEALSAPVVANDPDGKTKTISTEAGLRRLGRQLQRTEQELWSDLGLRALRVGKVEKALKILSELYEHHSNSNTGKVLFTAAKTLCQMLQADVPMVIPEGMDLPAVIHNLACQAITLCNSDLLLDCLELCKCTRIAMDVYHQCQLSDDYGFIAKAGKDSYSQWSFQDVFNEDCIVLDPVSVLPVQYEITNCLLPIPQDTKLFPLDCSCLSHCSFEDGSNYLQTLLGPLTSMLQMLQECSQLELALRELVNSYGSCLQHVTSNVMDTKLSVQVGLTCAVYIRIEIYIKNLEIFGILGRFTFMMYFSSLGLQVFNWRVVDCDLAIGLCTLLPKTEVFKILWKVIDNTWQNYDKILAVAKIGADLCSLYNEPEEQKKFVSVITDAEWGVKLGKLEISIQPVFRQRPELKSCLIPEMVKNRKITPDIILQYCSTFGLDRDRVINQYITTLLLLQEDDGGSSAGAAGSGLDEEQPLLNKMSPSFKQLSPYNYERIGVVLKIIQVADEYVAAFSLSQAMGLLQHLKSYRRVSPPSDVENTYLLENGLMPNPLSSSRLPFHLLMQTKHFWKIISPELNEETFPTLLLISKLMKVSLDKLYMSAANHVFEKKMKPLILEQRKRAQGHGYSKETLKVAKTMMKYIQCIQSLEWAAATAHKITQELPPGLEKTQSLRYCLGLGEAWLKDPNLEVCVATFLSKLKLQFQRSATENMLISSQLSSPELLKLSGLPARLIMALYEHSSVEQRYRETGGQTFPDIHAAVREIATINNVDLGKICNMLLEKWICKTGPALEHLFCRLPSRRAVHLLQSYPVDDAIRLLSPILFPLSSSGPRLTFCHRTRVLLCLIRLADAETLEAQLQIPRSKFKCYLKSYIFVSQLEALNIPYTVQSFLSSPKDGLVKGLWRNHSHEPQAVRLVADLCLEYQVYDPQLWNSLLQKLLGFNLVRAPISSFSRTWRSMILAPFVSAFSCITFCLFLTRVSLTGGISTRAVRSYFIFIFCRCPFLLNLDLIGIANRFAQFNLHAFALGTLLLIPCAHKKAQQIQGFLSMCNPVAVLEQVDEFMNTGELAGIPSQVRLDQKSFYSPLTTVCIFRGKHVSQDDADSLTREYLKHREQQRGKTLSNGCLKVHLHEQTIIALCW
uniref:Uncharacterized protein n=1 Tax=Poecilia mexicana TaxID=48701 RepID=A0A3B3YVA8_9TELE